MVDSGNNGVAVDLMGPKKRLHQTAGRIKSRFFDAQDRGETQKQLRVILYSHDTMGVGHMRRNLLIAAQITRSIPDASVLVIAGAKEANTFAQQAGIDCLTLPAYQKNSNGEYTTRNLGISVEDVLSVRSETILAAIKSFRPDLFIVDKVPAGAGGELLPSLEWLTRETHCHCVLGLRDILDSPDTVIADWRASDSVEILKRHFASIWIYGDPSIYDSVQEYQFPQEVARMARYTGYLNTESRLSDLRQLPYEIEVPYVLCTVGGGQDGEQLASCFVEAMRSLPRNAVLLTGPYMPKAAAQSLKKKAEKIPKLKVVEFVDEGDLLVRNASHVVSMGGYNTVAAILSHHKKALIVPRCVLRQEQLLRAERLAARGLVTTIHPDRIQPGLVNEWLASASDPTSRSNNLNMDGLSRISQIIESEFQDFLSTSPSVNGVSPDAQR